MEEMLKEAQYCQKIIATKFKKPLKMSDGDEQHFQEANEYHICNQAYTNKDIGAGITVISQVVTGDRHTKIVT